MRTLLLIAAVLAAAPSLATESYPPPKFTDPSREAKLAGAYPSIDRLFEAYARDKHVPGLAWGIVIDGKLTHTGFAGVRDLKSNAPLNNATAFRIASMTKSFTTLAVLKLRDAGKLSLEDPVSKWIPEFKHSELPTADSAPITVRQLLSHSAGFPEDNPWGDQQLSQTDEQVTAMLNEGFPFSTPPGTRYEYSNLAFGLLGRIVGKASGVPYETYVREEILKPLHMDGSTFRFEQVANERRAIGYRLKPDGSYAEEPPLPQGAFGSMGGLLTTTEDMGRYVAFHLSAWPARDDADSGPVRRSSVRQMSELATPSNLTANYAGGKLVAMESGYGFGLRISSDCRFAHIVSHGGGLPGFGSFMQWLPDYGVGMFAMATLTYSGPAEPISKAWDAMAATGALKKREQLPSPRQSELRGPILALFNHWDDEAARKIGAMNLLLDFPGEQRRVEIEALKAQVGECHEAGPVLPENWLRGQINIPCSNGLVGVFFTLAPTKPARVQHLSFRRLDNPDVRLGAPTGPPAGVSCSIS